MKPTLLIFLLVILLVLLFVSLGVAGTDASTRWFTGGLDLANASWSRTVRDWLTQRLSPADIVNMWPGACRPSERQFVVAPEVTCTATILGSNKVTRQLSLQLIDGQAVTVVLEQENALTVEIRLEHTADPDATPTPLDIYKNADLHNATLRLHSCELPPAPTPTATTADTPTAGEQQGTAAHQPPSTCVVAVQ